MTYRSGMINTAGIPRPRRRLSRLRLHRVAAYLVRYGVVFVTPGVGCVINGRERGEGRRADSTDRFLVDLRTSAADIFVQSSRTL